MIVFAKLLGYVKIGLFNVTAIMYNLDWCINDLYIINELIELTNIIELAIVLSYILMLYIIQR